MAHMAHEMALQAARNRSHVIKTHTTEVRHKGKPVPLASSLKHL